MIMIKVLNRVSPHVSVTAWPRTVPRRRRVRGAKYRGMSETPRTGTILDCPQMSDFFYAPMQRVVLHYSGWSEDGEIATRVRKAVPMVSRDHAQNAAAMARLQGTAIVLTAEPGVAEDAVSNLHAQGLRATVMEA